MEDVGVLLEHGKAATVISAENILHNCHRWDSVDERFGVGLQRDCVLLAASSQNADSSSPATSNRNAAR